MTVALGISIVNCDAGLYRYVWNQVDTVSHVDMDLDRNSAVCTRMPQSHTQPGHKPDLMRVKMSWNSPRIDDNLHTVRVETAR